MTITALHRKLTEAYSVENLNRIAITLLTFYKNQQFSTLAKIANHIGDYISIEIDDFGKGFSKFMMLYHPDRANFHINAIDQLFAENNYNGLLRYSHILLLAHIKELASSLENFEDIDYSPVYEWDLNAEGFSIIHDSKRMNSAERSFKERTAKCYYNFYDAVKVRMFDSTEKEYPSYYLEDIDEFELASSNINDLDGVEYCKHVKTLDLSDNKICDITPLFGLRLLEELNLSENDLSDIDVLSNFEQLRVIRLASNNINDISPIMDLPRLEYVDLSGTKVSSKQVDALRELGITVDV